MSSGMSATSFPSQLSGLTTTLGLYYLTPIYAIGILGNLVNIHTFLRRILRNSPCSQYFVGLSVAQIILCNSFAISRIIIYATGFDITRTVDVLCKLRIYAYVLGLGLMRQFLCLIALDRWFLSSRNGGLRRLSSKRIHRWLTVGSTSFWILYSIHTLIGFQISNASTCSSFADPNYALFYPIQNTVTAILPFICMTVSTILTLLNIAHPPRQVLPTIQNRAISAVVTIKVAQIFPNRRYETQLIKISLLQVSFYVLLCSVATAYPLYIFITISQMKSAYQNAIDAFFNTMGLLLSSTYTATTFFLYTLASKTFRKEFHLACGEAFKYIRNRLL